MHDPVPLTGAWLRSEAQGYFNYYAVPGNLDSLGLFRERVLRYWGKRLGSVVKDTGTPGSSQADRTMASYTWRDASLALDRFAATHPR